MSTPGSASSPEPGGGAGSQTGAAYHGFSGTSSAMGNHQHQHPSPSHGATQSSAHQQQQHTTTMRNRQALGQDPYRGGNPNPQHGLWDPPNPHGESLEMRERRAYAVSVLNSPELLMHHAHLWGDSIAGTRLRFTRMMCGFENKPGPEFDLKESRRTPRKRAKHG